VIHDTPCPVCSQISTLLDVMDARIDGLEDGGPEQHSRADELRRWRDRIKQQLDRGKTPKPDEQTTQMVDDWPRKLEERKRAIHSGELTPDNAYPCGGGTW